MKIAIAGPLQSGKTTVANYLEETYDIPVWSVGHYVRCAAVEMGVDVDEVFATIKSVDVRQLLQTIGHSARGVDEDIWIDKLLDDYHFEGGGDAVVDDMRYQNEAYALRDEGFKLVWIDAPLIADDGDHSRTHPSENDFMFFADWDARIYSSPGDVQGLFGQVDELIKQWEGE